METGLLDHFIMEISHINLTDNQLRRSLQAIAIAQGHTQETAFRSHHRPHDRSCDRSHDKSTTKRVAVCKVNIVYFLIFLNYALLESNLESTVSIFATIY